MCRDLSLEKNRNYLNNDEDEGFETSITGKEMEY